MSACCICHVTSPTDGNLIDGSVFHRRCYAQMKEDAAQLSRAEAVLVQALHRPVTFGDRIASLFSESRGRRILEEKQSLKGHIEQARAKQQAIKATLVLVYDVWPSYPPDWDERRCKLSSAITTHAPNAELETGFNSIIGGHSDKAAPIA